MRRWLAVWICVLIALSVIPHGASFAAENTPAWTSRTSGTQSDLVGIATGAGRVVVVGKRGTALTSATGEQWTAGTTGTDEDLKAVAYGGSLFVAVGNNGTVLVSTEGAGWASRTVDTAEHLLDVTYGGGAFVAVGDAGTVLRSTDGQSWTLQPSGADSKLYSVAYGAGTFVAVGYDGTILTSSAGAVWTRRSSGTKGYLTGVTYGPDGFVAVGEKGIVLRSANGLSWSSGGVGDSGGLWQVAAGLGQYVGVGGAGRILSSPDGATWTLNAAEPTLFLNDIAFINGQFIAVGDEGKIRTSTGQPLAPDLGSGGEAKKPVETGEPTTVIRPEQVRCEQGVVAGARVASKIGGLLIEADGAAKQEDQWETFCGNVSLNSLLKLDGVVKANPQQLEVSGNGKLYIESNLPHYPGQIVLFDGQFTFSGDLSEVVKQSGLDHLEVAGLSVEIAKLKLVMDGVQVGGELKLPVALGGLTVKVENLEIIRGQIDVKGEIALPDLTLGKSRLGLEDAVITFDSKANAFGGQGTLVIPRMFDISGEIGFKNARLEKVGVGLSGLTLAIDGSGLFLESIYGGIDGLTDPSTMKITARTTVYAGLQVSGFTAIKGKDLTLVVDMSGKLSGSGTLVLLEYFEVANGQFEISYAEGFQAGLEINIVDVIEANLELKVNRTDVYGKARASFQVPEWLPVVGGRTTSDVSMGVDNRGLSGQVNLGRLGHVTVDYRWRGTPRFGGRILGLTVHRVPYLASTVLQLPNDDREFVMPDGLGQVFVSFRWDAGDADITLIAPDGRVIAQEDNPSEGVQFLKEPAERRSTFSLVNPAAGTWKYNVTPNGATSYTVEVIELEQAPRVTFTAPATDITEAGPVRIRWTTQAPAGSKVSLFYATTPDEPGVMIASGVDAAAGTFLWDTSDVPSGTYYILGTVDDGESARVQTTAAGKVRLANRNTPATPHGFTARAVNGQLELEWRPNGEPNLAGYRIHLAGAAAESIALGHGTRFTWTGLQPGRSYQVGVSAYNDEGLESERSAPVTVFLPAAVPPSLRVNWPAQTLTNAKMITVSGQIEVGATGTLYRDEEVLAQGLTGAFSRQVSLRWGENRLRVVAIKPNGDAADSSRAYMHDSIAPQLTIENLPPSLTVSGSRFTLTGRVEPTAVLTLNGKSVPVQADGSYAATMTLVKGANRVELVARDGAGNENAFRNEITSTGGKACGTAFPDMGAQHPACEAVELLASRSVIAGYTDGTFHPERRVTRAEFAKMLVAALGMQPQPGTALRFGDVQGHWAAGQGYLQTAVALGAIAGFPDGSFKPNDPITRAQVVKIAAAAAGLEPSGSPAYADVGAQDWFAGWAATAERAQLIGPRAASPVWVGAQFQGNAPATRAEAAMVLANLLANRSR